MRFAILLSYKGTHYHGWQIQHNKTTVQEVVQSALTTLLRVETEVIGCGRTDTGVHAKYYVAHFDYHGEKKINQDLIYHLNAILPGDIAIDRVLLMNENFHARFDAISRTYEYFIHGYKSPFMDESSYRIRNFDSLPIETLQEAADLLLKYKAFFPFCLSNSGVDHYDVNLLYARWEMIEARRLKFTIQANRFLRGMVRLVTGMCVQVALGQLTKDDVIEAMDYQTLLPKSLSLPAHALYLTEVEYPKGVFLR